MMQPDLFGEPPRRPEASQWFTPPWIARRLAAWVPAGARVLEPACGGGNLIAALLERGHDPRDIYAIEADQAWATRCSARFDHQVPVACHDFLSYSFESFRRPFDLVLGNFPFEDNAHTRFTLRALELAPVVVAVYPVSFEFSQTRDRELWVPKARVLRRARMPERVDYGGSDSPKFDSVALHIERRPEPRPADEVWFVAEEVWEAP